jgi:hypothetical protein
MTASDEIRAALAKMTPGVWEWRKVDYCSPVVLSGKSKIAWAALKRDAFGIVTLRNRAPDLLAERDQLAAENARLARENRVMRKALEAIWERALTRDPKWFGMTTSDIAIAALKEAHDDA